MTDDKMNLRALVEKTADADLLRKMIGFAAQRLMELEVENLTGAGYGMPFGTIGCPSFSSLSATMWAASNSIGSGSRDTAHRPPYAAITASRKDA
jgi:hypothetical protein